MKVKIKILRENAKKPVYATDGSAAADIFAAMDEPMTIRAGERTLIPSGIAIELGSPDYVALMYPRSGLAIKRGLTLSNAVGVIDSDYRGEIMVPLYNISDTDREIIPGERIAQLCITPVKQVEFEVADELEETARGAGGFGSTGRV